jgi:hypothetical protein
LIGAGSNPTAEIPLAVAELKNLFYQCGFVSHASSLSD